MPEAAPPAKPLYAPSREGIHSLLVAAPQQGSLKYAAELTSGFSREAKWQLAELLDCDSLITSRAISAAGTTGSPALPEPVHPPDTVGCLGQLGREHRREGVR